MTTGRKERKKADLYTIAVMGLLGAVLVAAQVGLAFLPNIELVSLLILLYTLVYKKKVFYIIYLFVLIEGFWYGFGMWWLNYLYVWSVWAVVVLLMQKNRSVIIWSVACGMFGLSFGALCSVPYFLAGGIGGGLAYWTAGIPFDILHCIGNAAATFLLFKPLYWVLCRLQREGVRD